LKLYRTIFLTVFALACAGGLRAQVGSVFNTSGFSGTATVINFNTLTTDRTVITNQFSAQGVTFSGTPLYSSTNSADLAFFPSTGGGVIASTWNGSSPTSPLVINFTTPQLQAGFNLEIWGQDTINLTTKLNGNVTGTVSYINTGAAGVSSNLTAVFFGVKDPGGFNSLSITVTGSLNNQFLAIDDLRFQAIPEPSTVALLGAGLGLTALLGFRRRHA
jgi:hypothetical protein